MRAPILIALALLVSGCSCHREPEAQTPPVAAAPPAAAPPSAAESAARSAQSKTAQAYASAMSQAVSTTHAYLAAVAGKDWTKADTFWVGGKPAPRADDFAVRSVQDLRSMRINNDAPKPLDRESPPQSLEIPVTLRVRKDSGIYEIKGWYRLRRKITGDGWEITSASLQPSLG